MVYQNMVYTHPRRYSNGNETVLRLVKSSQIWYLDPQAHREVWA